jgi:hypothetical protein
MIFVSELRRSHPETMQRAVIHIRATPRFRNSENVEMNGHRAMRLAES